MNLDNLDELPDVPETGEEPVQDAEPQPVEAAPVEEAAEDAGESADEELDPGAKAVEEFSKSLRTLEGKWYVLHTYSGYEKRVKTNVESRVASFGLEDKIFQVEVPMEEVEKHTDKGKKVITRVRVPGYVLIRMWPDEDARRIVRETEGVTGFVGPTKDPAPLSHKEVVAMMAPMIASEALKKAGDKPAAAKKRTVEVSYVVGDQVTVTDGPFATEAHRARVHLRARYAGRAGLRSGREAQLTFVMRKPRSGGVFPYSSPPATLLPGRLPSRTLLSFRTLMHRDSDPSRRTAEFQGL